MVFCFLPGTRPASVMFCMMSACCFNWQIMWVWFDIVQYCLSAHFHWNASVFDLFLLGFFLRLKHLCRVWSACRPLLYLWAVLGLHYVVCCNPVHWYSEGKHVLFALPASVPPTSLGRLQVHSYRLWILLHIQHHCLPHWLWNPVPAGELQLQDGSHAWYGFSKAWPNRKCSVYYFPNDVFCYKSNSCSCFISFGTGTSTVCTPEQYKDCADPALGKPTHFTAEVLNVMESPRILHRCLNVKVFNQQPEPWDDSTLNMTPLQL